jgi:hypothetical protein
VLTEWIDPLLPPPGIRFIQPATVMVARNIIDIFPPMFLEGAELVNNLFTLWIDRESLCSRHIAHINGNLPVKGRRTLFAAEFGLRDGLR